MSIRRYSYQQNLLVKYNLKAPYSVTLKIIFIANYCLSLYNIIKCSKTGYYTGCTRNLEKRIQDHNSGKVHYILDKRPIELVSFISFSDKYKTFDFEKYLKTRSGRAFMYKRLV